MKNYTFTVVCASGATKEFTCQAANQKEALKLLREFAQVN